MDTLLPAPAEADAMTPNRRHATMLATMAEMGMSKDVVAALASFGSAIDGKPQMPEETRRFVAGPIIVHKAGGWEKDIPEWMAPQIAAERVEIAMGTSPYPIVGPTEIAAVMMPASFQAPFQHDAAALYLWAGARAAARHYKRPVTEYEFQVHGPDGRAPQDRDVIVRGGWLWEVYRSLSEEIRRKVISHQRTRERDHRMVAAATEPGIPPPPVVIDEQLSFFDRLRQRLAS